MLGALWAKDNPLGWSLILALSYDLDGNHHAPQTYGTYVWVLWYDGAHHSCGCLRQELVSFPPDFW
jgi:hypothetical protein